MQTNSTRAAAVPDVGFHLVFFLTTTFMLLGLLPQLASAALTPMILKPATLLPPSADRDWLAANVPLFECPDPDLQQIYYFRWHVYHEHLKQTDAGWIVTEFTPKVPWAGKDNSICCAAGHHIREGRWLRDPRYIEDYCRFWFHGGGDPRRYSFWAADSVYAFALASGDQSFAISLLPDLVNNYNAWEESHRDKTGDYSGLFWQNDSRDGMEYSIGGSGYRPTINAYQYGDAVAIAKIADWAHRSDIATDFRSRASKLKALVQQKLWDPKAQFFETLSRPRMNNTADGGKDNMPPHRVDVREEIGFVPWYFNLPDPGHGYEIAWKQLTDDQGFAAPFGPPTAERRSPRFNFVFKHDCLWNGPSWPFATTQTLVALANVLNNYPQEVVTKADYLTLLTNYAKSQHKDGHPWIAEDLDAYTGKWIVDKPRSVDYNHSGFADLVISGLVGLRPRADDTVEINPLIPPGQWDWFCLDGVPYHDHSLTIFYDKTGDHYHKGVGLHLLADGREIATADTLGRLTGTLPPAPGAH